MVQGVLDIVCLAFGIAFILPFPRLLYSPMYSSHAFGIDSVIAASLHCWYHWKLSLEAGLFLSVDPAAVGSIGYKGSCRNPLCRNVKPRDAATSTLAI